MEHELVYDDNTLFRSLKKVVGRNGQIVFYDRQKKKSRVKLKKRIKEYSCCVLRYVLISADKLRDDGYVGRRKRIHSANCSGKINIAYY